MTLLTTPIQTSNTEVKTVGSENPYGEPFKIRCTQYTDYGVTKSGQMVREGIAASSFYYGKTILAYEVDEDGKVGDFIGFYEVLDTGSHRGLKDGSRIDIYVPTDSDVEQWQKEYGDYIYIQVVDGKG